MSARPLLEIAANSAVSALAAEAGGADRIELCASLADGGVTPSFGTIALARERLRIPLYVLIRPRAGDFSYGNAEFDIMQRDIEACARLGCDGVVIGALDVDGEVDVDRCRGLIAAAGTLGVTFHRAFDAARDQARALERVIALGCERVLTSGACATALEGADTIAALVRQSAGRIRIMAGAGVRPDNIADLMLESHAHEFHASAKTSHRSSMRWHNAALDGLQADYDQSDESHVAALVRALSKASARA